MAKKTVSKTNNKAAKSSTLETTRQGIATTEKVGKSRKSASVPKTKASCKTQIPTHEQIAERAKNIWQEHGCAVGQDEKNWFEAETQLKVDLGINN